MVKRSKVIIAGVTLAVALHGVALAADACRALLSLKLPQTEIMSAEAAPPRTLSLPGYGPGGVQPVETPAMCRLAGRIAPAIRFEVWLPLASAWNGRFQHQGVGGYAGNLNYGEMGRAVRAGYVTTSTDTGHAGPDPAWMADKGLVADYAYRAVHEVTVAAKGVIAAYYGKPQQWSYFNGCSNGGREALIEAQRYPGDFDGIIAGAPAHIWSRNAVGSMWPAQAVAAPGAALSEADLVLLNNAVLKQCEALDGVADGVLEDPRRCGFDPAALQCKPGQTSGCLAPAQVEAVRKIYAGARNPRTGEQLLPGLMRGGEAPLNWSRRLDIAGMAQASLPMRYMITGDLSWDWRTFDFDKDVARLDAQLAPVLDATDPDLRRFREHGGKLILYHGWSDASITPLNTVGYYERVAAQMEREGPQSDFAATSRFARLFMFPGVGHCAGGTGPDRFDFMPLLTAWVEQGAAPIQVIASRAPDAEPQRSRPVCAYPMTARYKGAGDTNAAESFVCAKG